MKKYLPLTIIAMVVISLFFVYQNRHNMFGEQKNMNIQKNRSQDRQTQPDSNAPGLGLMRGQQRQMDNNTGNNTDITGSLDNQVDSEIGYTDISAQQAKKLIDENPNLVVLDVSNLYDRGHIPGAINYYVGDGSLDGAIPTLDANAMYLVYCHADSASIAGAEKLVEAGFVNVYRLEGNYPAWVRADFEVEM